MIKDGGVDREETRGGDKRRVGWRRVGRQKIGFSPMMEKWRDLKGRRQFKIKEEGTESKTTGFFE